MIIIVVWLKEVVGSKPSPTLLYTPCPDFDILLFFGDSYCSSSDTVTFLLTGACLALKGAVFPNHGVINKDPSVIGEDEDALYCVTDNVTCCGTPPTPECCDRPPPTSTDGGSGNGQGHWYFPNSNKLKSGTAEPFLWYARWLTGAVLMNFRGTATTGTTGLHRCAIHDSMGSIHQLYTCVYYNGTVGSQCK